jgi:deoxyhypusine synthase
MTERTLKNSGEGIDLQKVRLYPIRERVNKVSVSDFLDPESEIGPFRSRDLERLGQKIVESHKRKGQIIAMLGAHVIKCGLSLYVVDLMQRGVITHVALNGAGAIHDFEIGLIGATSEHVEGSLTDGSFGMAKETGTINEIVKNSRVGFGHTVGEYIEKNLKYRRYSILANAYRFGLPATVHVAIGTDIIHQHPNFDGAATGKATYDDFKASQF